MSAFTGSYVDEQQIITAHGLSPNVILLYCRPVLNIDHDKKPLIMNEAKFNDLIDETLTAIEDAIDASETDIDCENTGGVLTLTCEDGSSIIFSRQIASKELWIAARSGGFHLAYTGGQWFCQKHQQSLTQLFAKISKEQAGEAVALG